MSKLIDADKLREYVDKRESYTVTSEALAEEINNYLDEAPDPSPIEYSEEFAENIRILLQDKLSGHSEDGSISWATLIDDKTLKDIVTGIWFYVGKEALKYPKEELNVTEWSEEDEKLLNKVEVLLDDYCDFLEDESSRFIPEVRETISRLKSLRPQPKAELTLLDENIIKAAVAFVEQNDHFNCWDGIDKHTVIKALRSLKPSWKPSEEQMEALKFSLGNGGKYNREALTNLYDNLKKLM